MAARSGETGDGQTRSAPDDFEGPFFSNMTLVLDRSFVHRVRMGVADLPPPRGRRGPQQFTRSEHGDADPGVRGPSGHLATLRSGHGRRRRGSYERGSLLPGQRPLRHGIPGTLEPGRHAPIEAARSLRVNFARRWGDAAPGAGPGADMRRARASRAGPSPCSISRPPACRQNPAPPPRSAEHVHASGSLAMAKAGPARMIEVISPAAHVLSTA